MLACAAILALASGCAKSSGSDEEDPETPSAPQIAVYAAGNYNDGAGNRPCYWKDSTRVDLPYGANDEGRAVAVAVSGGNVYSAGYVGGHVYNPCYWTGTTRTDLSGENATSIRVADGKVYTAVNGDWSSGGITAFGGAYYADSTLYRLAGIASGDSTRPERDTTVNAIAVADGTVYAAGRAAYSIYDSYACYWTGPDARTDLDASSEALAICVSGGTVYTAGDTYGSGANLPCYWTGATMTMLPIGSSPEGQAKGIQVVDGTVYIAGYYTDGSKYVPCIWTDGVRADLPGDGTNGAQAYALWVFEGSVYVSGFYSDGLKDIPCYWKDGTRVDLPGGTTSGYANGIVVVKE